VGLVASHHQDFDSVGIDACVGNFVPNAVIVVHDETLASRDAIAPVSNCIETTALVGRTDKVLARRSSQRRALATTDGLYVGRRN
jgi:hypothetical protein